MDPPVTRLDALQAFACSASSPRAQSGLKKKPGSPGCRVDVWDEVAWEPRKCLHEMGLDGCPDG